MNGYRRLLPLDRRFHKIIPYDFIRTNQQINITEDTTHTEFILVFQIASVAPFQNEDRQFIFPLPNRLAHIKFAGGMGYLAITDIIPIQPYIKAGIHTFKIQICFRRILFLPVIKFIDISTTRIIPGNIRRIKRKRIADVGILVGVVSGHLPDPGNIYPFISRIIITIFIKFLFQVIYAVIIAEFPFPAQNLYAVRVLPFFHKRVHLPGCRDIIRAGRHRIFMQHV